MPDQPMKPLTIENVDEFDVWILDSDDFVVTILPVSAPWNAVGEGYAIDQASEH